MNPLQHAAVIDPADDVANLSTGQHQPPDDFEHLDNCKVAEPSGGREAYSLSLHRDSFTDRRLGRSFGRTATLSDYITFPTKILNHENYVKQLRNFDV